MWVVNDQEIRMTVGDFGVALPITIDGTDLTAADEIKLIIKSFPNGTAILEKTFANIVENSFSLELTDAESRKLHAGPYVYTLDWYQNGVFMCNIIPGAKFKVVSKA